MSIPDPVDAAVNVLLRALDARQDDIQDAAAKMLAQGLISATTSFLGLTQDQVERIVDHAAVHANPTAFLRERIVDLIRGSG